MSTLLRRVIIGPFAFLALLCCHSICSGQSYSNQIDSIAALAVPDHNGPGVIIGVIDEGVTHYSDSRGLMNLEYQLPFNDSTVFGLASVTKQFTASCIAVLQNRGKLSIEDDARKYIPELPFYGDTIRVKHLLNHTSGIRNHNVLLDLKGFDYNHHGFTNESIEQLIFRQAGINNLPGEKMLYSNTNYVLLALIVKRVSGKSLDQFAKEEIFSPLEMHDTFYMSDLSEVIRNSAHNYYQAGGDYKTKRSLTLCIGAGGMRSSMQDMLKWAQVLLDRQHPYHYLAEFITDLDTLNNGRVMKHGRGMFVSPYKGYTTWNHSGRDIGMRSQLIVVPDLELGVVVFTNSEYINAVDLSYQVLDLVMPAEVSKAPDTNRPYSHTEIELKNFSGQFQELNSDMRMNMFVQNDTLMALSSFGRDPVPLRSATENSFTRLDNYSVVHSFPSDQSAGVDMMVDFGGAIFYFERIVLSSRPDESLNEFTGTYYSEELEVSYELSVTDSSLVLNYPNNANIILKEGVEDVFGSNRRTKYSFERDVHGQITSFTVASEGTVKDILFEKIDN